MAEIRDGLTTEMRYAVVASTVDFGMPAEQHGEDREFWGMRKPPFEAYKIVEVMQSWGATVYPVGNVESVAGLRCYPSLRDLPGPVDCAVISLPHDEALRVADDVVAAGIGVVWLQFGAAKDVVRAAFESRGIGVVAGCVLLHWDVDHVQGIAKARHVCYMHGNLERAPRIRVGVDGVARRIEPARPETMPFNRETFSSKLLFPVWPRHEPKA
jgi:predicted CoA-binding protein